MAAALATSVATTAQTPTAKPSPEDDIDCALIASIILESGEDMSADERTGIIAGMTYFIGRWEATRGGSLNAAMVEQSLQLDMTNFPVMAKTCGDRMEAMGARMTSAGAALEALAPTDSAPSDKESAPATADSESR